ncbi:MAG: hypothetical protein HXS48_19890 [Theionarchaea archaeon]|nr:hypothetical protein [Theionarchaea archaeon]
MKFHFKLSDEDRLKALQENWLIFLHEFFEEKTVFHTSQTDFLAFLDPHVIESYGHSRMLLFAHNRGKEQKVFESSILVGLLQGKSVSKIKHSPPFRFCALPEELVCIEFPLKGNKTAKGKYRIGIKVKDSGDTAKRLGEKFSIQFVTEFISEWAGIPGQVLTGWALDKLKNRKIHVSKADALYLGTTAGTQLMKGRIGKKIDIAEPVVGTAFSGVADGVLTEIFDTSSSSLTLTVV